MGGVASTGAAAPASVPVNRSKLIYAPKFTDEAETAPRSGPNHVDQAEKLAPCFLRLANLPSYPLDRLSRYEATLWRQAGQVLFTLETLNRLFVWRSSRILDATVSVDKFKACGWHPRLVWLLSRAHRVDSHY